MDLVLRTTAGVRRLSPADSVVLGRDPGCSVVVGDSRVSRRHVELSYVDGRWQLKDLGSHNGTFIGRERIRHVDLTGPVVVRLAHPDDGAEISIEPTPSRLPSAIYRVEQPVRIGRAADNDIVLPDLLVSRHHAEVLRAGNQLIVADRGSRNGSYLNGRRVERATLVPGDLLSFGKHEYVVDGTDLTEHVDEGCISLAAHELTVRAGDRTLLDRVSFALDERSLLAVVGPSGAGKSTLLGALLGDRPTSFGRVEYEGRDLFENFADLRHRIGLVPQEDILHRQLTVRRALTYAAQLRFPDDVGGAERANRIDEVMDQLDLRDRADQRIDTLSGGQRKRTSIALELLTEPSLLLLDEPTSGLDPALDRDVMVALRGLADSGRTVVVVTHSVLHLNVCDRLLVLTRGGKVGYFGPPDELMGYFGVDDYASVFEAVANSPDMWAERFRRRAAIHGDAQTGGPGPQPDGARAVVRTAAPPRQGALRQISVLSRRMLAVIAADRLYATLSLGVPLALAAMAHAVPGSGGLGPPAGPGGRSAEAQQLLVILVMGAIFMGTAAGIRELVGERAIYLRERTVGLSARTYLASKVLVFSLINATQALLLVYLGLLFRPGPERPVLLRDPMVELAVAMVVITVVSTIVGMLISAFVTTTEQVMPAMVGLVMLQLVLSGGLFALAGRGGLEQLAWLSPSRWGYAAAAATVDLSAKVPDPVDDPLWHHSAWVWLLATAVLAIMAAAALAGTLLALQRFEPRRAPRRVRLR